MRTSRLLTLLFLGTACALTCTGCFLLPSKDVSHQVVIETEAVQAYDMAAVIRGNVTLSKRLHCTYTELIEVEYAFQTGKAPVKYVFVSVGDAVSKGDILAKLDTSSWDAQFDNLTYEIDKLTLQLNQAKELREFDLNALSKSFQDGTLSQTAYDNEKESVLNRYQETIKGYEDALYIDGLRLEEVQKTLDGAYIYADFDGTISFVMQNLQDSIATSGQMVIREVDSSQCAFEMTDPEYVQYFTEGQNITMVDNNKNEYAATVLMVPDEEGNNQVYFLPTDADAGISVGTHASFDLIFEERENVLMVPSSTIHSAGGRTFVYCQDENGIKMLQYVSTGLKGNSYTEITDGLSEGDTIIK